MNIYRPCIIALDEDVSSLIMSMRTLYNTKFPQYAKEQGTWHNQFIAIFAEGCSGVLSDFIAEQSR